MHGLISVWGQCYSELRMMDSALIYLKNAVELDTTIKKEAIYF
jgi:hypothetical protein